MIAFKTYKDCPNNIKPASIPESWVWTQVEIPDNQKEAFEQSGFTVLSFEAFNGYKAEHQIEYDQWANSFDQNRTGQELRIMDLVQDQFLNLPPSKIDFRRHLKENVYLQKDVLALPNGRPQKALYRYNGEIIAEIEFVFEVNQFNLMTRRIEKLAYYKRNDATTEKWVIADDFYDASNPYHLREMMKERSEARSMIFEEIKAFLNGVFAAYYVPQGKTYAEILVIAGNLWNKFSTDIDSWVNVGSPKFSQNITLDEDFPVLDFEISAGVTLRAWILNKVSY
jgi:hypothetical protein